MFIRNDFIGILHLHRDAVFKVDPLIIEVNLLFTGGIVKRNHAFATHHYQQLLFVGMKPGHIDMGMYVMGVFQVASKSYRKLYPEGI